MKFYAESHEWAEVTGKIAKVGISDFAQKELGDIVFIELPEQGAEVTAGDRLCEVESVKAASEIFSPVTGRVVAVNESLEDAPEKINEDPLGSWFCEIELSEEPKGLMAEAEYLADK